MVGTDKGCKGCVCLSCSYSEQNGDFNRCPYKSCRLCNDDVYHVRSICGKGIHETKEAIEDIIL